MAKKPTLFPVFVYGTLRVDEYNYEWCSGCVSSHVLNVTAPGRLYWVRENRGYPVAKFNPNSENTIKGDILYCDSAHPLFRAMCDMEIGAGYEIKAIVCKTESGENIPAYGFHYKETPHGERIESGDWAEESLSSFRTSVKSELDR